MPHLVRSDGGWHAPHAEERFDHTPGPCRVLMQDGEWLVPPSLRPAVLPAPAEEEPVKRRVYATIPANGWMGREGR